MIQFLTYSGKEEVLKGNNVVVNSLHDAKSLDEFDINIIDLSNQSLWRCKDNSMKSINSINDIKSISVMIENSHSSNIIIMLPQNVTFMYYGHGEQYYQKCELKDMIPYLKEYILSKLYSPIKNLYIVYENTSTNLDGELTTASFYFNNITDNALTKSVKSNKVTTIGVANVMISTLKLSTYKEIIAFLKTIGLIKDKQGSPEWMEEVKMFDDEIQFEIISKNTETIRVANANITKAMEVISKNNEYKSVLYTSGDELVDTVFEILENMLGCDLSEFQDKKNEDFRFNLGDNVFIGEIKGITPSVKKSNVSQLDVHVQEYLDDHAEDQDSIVALLIINHQRNKAISEREPVHNDPIRIAERNGSLIVETITLLRLFEKYLNGEKTREECINILIDNKGILKI